MAYQKAAISMTLGIFTLRSLSIAIFFKYDVS